MMLLLPAHTRKCPWSPVATCLALVVILGTGEIRAAGAVSAAGAAAPAVARPNFVVVLSDDLGYGDLACYGNPDIKTPHLDHFASEGVRLTACYAAACNCSPSRTGLLTGRTPYRAGIHNWIPLMSPMHVRRSEITVATLLRQHGYTTCHVGKWHLNGRFNLPDQPQPADHGFDYWFSTQNNALPSHHNPDNFVRNGQPVGKLAGYSADLVAGEAIQWLTKTRDPDRPFFLFVCFHEPHEPIATAPQYTRLYSDEGPRSPFDPAVSTQAAHHGNVSQLDAAFGRLLAALDAPHLRASTLVLFTSDNGPAITNWHPHGSAGPFRDKKGSLHEGGIRVPGLIRWPDHISAGTVSAEPVSGVDLLPTLCDLAGVPLPEERRLDGISLRPLLTGQSLTRAVPLYWQFDAASSAAKVAIRDGDWKLLARLQGGGLKPFGDIRAADQQAIKHARLEGFELYNLQDDPGETRDVAASQPEHLARLQQQLTAMHREVVAESPTWPEWQWPRLEGNRIQAHRAALQQAAENWPTFGNDAGRSSLAAVAPRQPLRLAWTWHSRQAPQAAWPPPAKHDYWHHKYNLHPRVAYDHAFQPVVVGDRVYFGSSAEDQVVCLDADTGRLVWTFTTDGPVRLAPAVADGRLYVGSDDGWVYCLTAATGQLTWKARLGPKDSRVLGNGRLISRWPVRGGVTVWDGAVYAAAGLFPTSEGVYLAGYDAATGARHLHRRIDQPAEGYLVAADDRLYIPAGRAAPGVFDIRTGAPQGAIPSSGGVYTLLTREAVVAGHGDGAGELTIADQHTGKEIISFPGLHLLAGDERWIVHTRTDLAALDQARFLPLARQQADLRRQIESLEADRGTATRTQLGQLKRHLAELQPAMQACWQWRVACDNSESLIMAGNTLFAGGANRIVAYRAEDGHAIWETGVDGRACALAATATRLLIGTDQGSIYCFRPADLRVDATPQDHRPPRPVTAAADWTPARSVAAAALQAAKTTTGVCLVAGDHAGAIARAIIRQSACHVLIPEPRPERAAALRRQLQDAGIYGTRVAVHPCPDSLAAYPPYFANLVLVDADTANAVLEDPAAWWRLVRPHGGTLIVFQTATETGGGPVVAPLRARLQTVLEQQQGSWQTAQSPAGHSWLVARRGALPGEGTWTHGFAQPDNSSCSRDQRVHGPLRMQWFGGPGPRPMPDRHHRNVPPLYHAGRLFTPGDNLVIAVDAYNGCTIWQRDIPNSIRLGAFLDCTGTVVDEQAVYVAAKDKCHLLDVASGHTLRKLAAVQLDETEHVWGYVARGGSQLIGSACKPGAAYQEQSRQADLALWYDNMALVTSDYLFALDPADGQRRWIYRSGVIVNSTLTIGGGRLYFLESQVPAAVAEPRGRSPMSRLVGGENFLVALDLETGQIQWRRPCDLGNCRHIVYLSYAADKLILSGNRYRDSQLWYFFDALDARTGETAWQASHNSGYAPNGDHGEQNRHPTIIGDVVYTYPRAYALHTGRPIEGWQFDRLGHGCGNISASACGLFWRGGNPWQWDVGLNRKPHPINRISRPGCFINIIPAGGLLLIPEASSGCTCAYPLQTSLAYIPESDLLPRNP